MSDLPDRRGAPPPRRPPEREGLDEEQVRRLAATGALVLLITLVLVFIVENSRQVPVSFVFFSANISLIWVIVLSAVFGAVGAAVLGRVVRRRLGR